VVTTEPDVATTGAEATARRTGRRRVAPGPVARFQPGRVAEARHRNPAWLVAGALLVVLSALGGVLLFSANDERTEALVAARDLAPGAVVTRDDLRIERVAVDGVDVVAPSAVDGLLGQRAVGPVPQGALLHPAMFAVENPLGPDEMDIGAALDPGEFPQSDVPVGAAVELLVSSAIEPVAAPGVVGAEPPAARPDEAKSIGVGAVTAVEERATGQLLVTMRVSRDVGLVAAQAARDDTLRIALVGSDG
jgi:hypothetical protein